MKRASLSTWFGIGLFVATFAPATEASAESLKWVPVGVGCASAIGVGASDIPWVLGCANGSAATHGARRVYYLGSGTCQEFTCQPQWYDDGFDGVALSVNINGQPFVTDTTGTIFGEHHVTVNNVTYPSGEWAPFGPGAVSAFAVGVEQSYDHAANPVLWGPAVRDPASYTYSAQSTFWGMGCGSACTTLPTNDASPYRQIVRVGYGLAPSSSGWQQLPGGAIEVAVFTDPAPYATTGVDVPQTIWARNAAGSVFAWTGTYWAYVPTPEPALSLTDHHILGLSGAVFLWTGNASGAGGGAWTPLLYGGDSSTGQALYMKQIAWSQSISGTPAGTVGPSEIWGVTRDGVVARAQWMQDNIPPK